MPDLRDGTGRPSDETRKKISKSQRERYERERKAAADRRNELVDFALWIHPTWETENEDDVFKAVAAVDLFLEGNRA